MPTSATTATTATGVVADFTIGAIIIFAEARFLLGLGTAAI